MGFESPAVAQELVIALARKRYCQPLEAVYTQWLATEPLSRSAWHELLSALARGRQDSLWTFLERFIAAHGFDQELLTDLMFELADAGAHNSVRRIHSMVT